MACHIGSETATSTCGRFAPPVSAGADLSPSGSGAVATAGADVTGAAAPIGGATGAGALIGDAAAADDAATGIGIPAPSPLSAAPVMNPCACSKVVRPSSTCQSA